MKNLYIVLITLTVVVFGLLIPIQSAHGYPYVTTRCHYMYDGVELSTVHTELPGDVSCAELPEGEPLLTILEDNGIPVDRTKNLPHQPENHCYTIRHVITEY